MIDMRFWRNIVEILGLRNWGAGKPGCVSVKG